MVPGVLSRIGRQPAARGAAVKQPTDELGRLMPLVSHRTGVVKRLIPLAKRATEPTPPYVYCALLADHSNGAGPDRIVGVGKGETPEWARLGALAEAVERYCGTQPDHHRCVRGSLRALGAQALDPSDCVLYSDRQYDRPGFPFARFSADMTIPWTRGVGLPSKEPMLVPAVLTYLAPTWDGHAEQLCPPTSTGLATGSSLEMAVLHGLLEVVERDAFMTSWLTRRPCRRVDTSGLTGLITTVRDHYRQFGVQLVVDLTTDVAVHVMIAIAVDRGGCGPAAVIGLGAGLDPVAAAAKACLEVCQGRPGEAMRSRRDPPHQRLCAFDDVHDTMDHSALFSMGHMLGELEFLLSSAASPERLDDLPDRSTGTVAGDLERCLEALEEVGSKVVYVDVTTPDIAQLGLRVARTIATELQPTHFGYGHERLGGNRVFDLPARLGYSSRRLIEDDINPCPHPLA
jgi:ribosomal protein S12 methylthiotransferase accessory factor